MSNNEYIINCIQEKKALVESLLSLSCDVQDKYKTDKFDNIDFLEVTRLLEEKQISINSIEKIDRKISMSIEKPESPHELFNSEVYLKEIDEIDAMFKEISQVDKASIELLEDAMAECKKSIKKINDTKKSTGAYKSNPYIEGVFIDKKN